MTFLGRLTNRFKREIAKSQSSYYGKLYNSYSVNYEVEFALRSIVAMREESPVVLDIGANRGEYSSILVKNLPTTATIHCFEPSLDHVQALTALENEYVGTFFLHSKALSSSVGTKVLYKDQTGSTHASLYDRDLAYQGLAPLSQTEQIATTTLDLFVTDIGIEKISFLKVDVEGHELDVFMGAASCLREGRINALQFEFGGCNIDSRTYVKVFHEILVRSNGYSLYRLAPRKRLVNLNTYSESFECFTWQNLIALKNLSYLPRDYSIITE